MEGNKLEQNVLGPNTFVHHCRFSLVMQRVVCATNCDEWPVFFLFKIHSGKHLSIITYCLYNMSINSTKTRSNVVFFIICAMCEM